MKYLMIATALVLAISSCKKEEEPDTTKPVISMTNPSNEQQFTKGSNLPIRGTITDDKNLASYKLEIHEAGDHSHKSASAIQEAEWEIERTTSISGTKYDIIENITIPVDAEEAEYHVIIEALDEAGNAANLVELTIDVK